MATLKFNEFRSHKKCTIVVLLETMLQYDDVDEDVLRNYHEFSLANLLYFALKESACSEQSSRMSAMDNATKNAGKIGLC